MSTIFRELTQHEIDIVSGAGYYDSTGAIVVDGWRRSWGGSGGGGGGGGGGAQSDIIQDNTPPPEPSDLVKFTAELNDDDKFYFNGAIKDLYYGSQTAKTLIDKAIHDGYKFDINHVGNDSSDPLNKIIHWDPHSAIHLQNNDRSLNGKSQSAEIGLIHEIAHVFLGPEAPSYSLYNADGTRSPWVNQAEKDVITKYENVVVNEMNATFTTSQSSTRENDYGQSYYRPDTFSV